MMTQDIRTKFLRFFKEKNHTVVPSSAVIPHEDPTLLFTNAGMNQFKDVFLGQSRRDYTRAASSQKCIRAGGKHNDLENVGHTSRHLTFFEMLGNFSFGDYFKQEAIDFAWELVHSVFAFDPSFLYATVFEKDDESYELWKRYLPENKIVRMGEKDNFWAMGETGPCGPCSELYYDRGHHFGAARNPLEDTSGERFIEFWNLVFMEFNRKGAKEIEKLPKLSVDTGAGLERVIALKMGVESLFETDILRELIAQVENVFHVTYNPQDPRLAPAFRVIADHIRTLSFACADGAQPSNTERGYVLRKILRRAVRYGRMLGRDEPFLAKILPRLTATMGQDYPELKQAESRIAEILTTEEESFLRTLRRGGQLLHSVMEEAKNKGHVISGEDAFKLKDTYGLPLDEITLLAIDHNLKVDLPAFEKLEKEAKERSRSTRKETEIKQSSALFETLAPSTFVGYGKLKHETHVTALMKEGQLVDVLAAGEEGLVFLQETPFYAEKGGQVGDVGVIEGKKGSLEISDTQSPFPGVIAHYALVKTGEIKKADPVVAQVTQERRQKIANNHTATHLLHLALQKVLGEQVKQAGSVVDAERLRFDFSHHKPLTKEELIEIEKRVNEMIRQNSPVTTTEMPLTEASKHSEIKQFFGEKYASIVRVVQAGESKELCGGTHTSFTGTLGFFKISKESSIAAGVRRIEAVTGTEAEKEIRAQEEFFLQLGTLLKVQPTQLLEKIEKLVEENRELIVQKEKLRKDFLSLEIEKWRSQIVEMKGMRVLIGEVAVDGKELKALSEMLSEKEPSLALLLIAKTDTACSFVAKVSSDLIQKGILANEWLKGVAAVVGGKGGGKADFAQGGGTLPAKTQEALDVARQWIALKNEA